MICTHGPLKLGSFQCCLVIVCYALFIMQNEYRYFYICHKVSEWNITEITQEMRGTCPADNTFLKCTSCFFTLLNNHFVTFWRNFFFSICDIYSSIVRVLFHFPIWPSANQNYLMWTTSYDTGFIWMVWGMQNEKLVIFKRIREGNRERGNCHSS